MTRLAALVAGLALIAPASAAAPSDVSFWVTQKGTAVASDVGPSTTSGTGTLGVGGPYRPSQPTQGPVYGAVQGGAIVHTDSKGGVRISLRVLGGYGHTVNAAGAGLSLDVKVVASNDSACAVGTRGVVFLSDAKIGGDELLLDVCDHQHVYTSGGGDVLTVKLGAVAASAASKSDPVALVRQVLGRNAAKCELKIGAMKAERTKFGWRVTAAVTTFGNPGSSVWTVIGSKVTPGNQLASEIAVGCP